MEWWFVVGLLTIIIIQAMRIDAMNRTHKLMDHQLELLKFMNRIKEAKTKEELDDLAEYVKSHTKTTTQNGNAD